MLILTNRFVPAILVKRTTEDAITRVVSKVVNTNSVKPADFKPYEDDDVIITTPLCSETEFVLLAGLGDRVASSYWVFQNGKQVERSTTAFRSGIAISTSVTEEIKAKVYKTGILDARGIAARMAEVNSKIRAITAEQGVAIHLPVKYWDLNLGVASCASSVGSHGLQVNPIAQSTKAAIDAVCGAGISGHLPGALLFSVHASQAESVTRVPDADAARLVAQGRKLIGLPVHLMLALARGNEQADFTRLYGLIAGISESFVKALGEPTATMSVADLFMDQRDAVSAVLGRQTEDPEFALEVYRGNADLEFVSGSEAVRPDALCGLAGLRRTDLGVYEATSANGAAILRAVSLNGSVMDPPSDLQRSMKDVSDYLNLVYALYCGFNKRSPYIKVAPSTLQWMGVNLGRAGGLFHP